MKRVFGLIGYPLSHSFSKGYFSQKFKNEKITDSSYEVFPLENIEDFVGLCKQNYSIAGLNVTIPYKEKIIPFLDGLNDEAKIIGAVNTIKFIDGKKIGYNTDCYGFENSIKPFLKPYHTDALILGSGGAAKAIEYVLNKKHINFKYVSRKKNNLNLSYSDLNKSIIQESTVIINCSPVGMYPSVDKAPEIPYDGITDRHLLYDLVYNPAETLFLRKGKEKGAQTKNGLEMLYLQAEKSWQIWQTQQL